MIDRTIDRRFWAIFVPALIGIGLVPLFVDSEYFLRIATLIVFWIAMAGTWNISCGYTGYVDFGPVVYFGIGAYATAISMTRLGISFFPAVGIGGLAAMAVSIPIGFTTLRLRGAYFAIATFAFAESMKQVALEFDRTFGVSLFEGSHGLTLPIGDHQNAFFFYSILAVALGAMLTQYWIERSRFGLGLKAINEAEDAAETTGVNTTGVKLQAYAVSALFRGMLGGIEAYWITYITPADVFNVHKTVQMVIMSLLGGMGTFLGPVVGGSLLTVLYEVLGTTFVEYYLILVGAIIVLIIVVMPRGIVGTLKAWKGLRFI
jgi:branched-chain amino acid transport system permease protein